MDDKNKLRELILNKKEFIINHKEEIYEQALVAIFYLKIRLFWN